MKQTFKFIVLTLSVLLVLLCCISCASQAEAPKTGGEAEALQSEENDSLWANADYTEDTAFGSGKKEIQVEVKAGEKSITFTIKTDKENLADAMLEHSLVEGEDGQYGLYIKKVNGILADYDEDQTYWSLSKDGEMLMTGASETKISNGEHFEFTKAKG